MKSKGFSLVEAVISIFIFAMIMWGIGALVPFVLSSANKQSVLLSNNAQATKVAFTLMKELRNAVTSANGAYPLVTANNQQLIFYTDAGTTINRINYFVQSGTLRKGVIVPTGVPAVYNAGSEVVTTVQNDLANGANPIFLYYNENFDGSGNALSQPVSITAVRFIKINLSVYNKGGVANTNSYTVTAGGSFRNLKTNLGN
jgi:Tfp pilus assembly protein PilV